jgi:hypothetical protein
LPDLSIEIGAALRCFLGPGVAIIGRAALDDIGDENLLARDTDRRQHAIEQLSRAPDEWLAAQIFIVTGTLADDQQVRLARTDAGNLLGTIL